MNKKQLFFDILFTFLLSFLILFGSFGTSFYVANSEARNELKIYGDEIKEIYIDETNNEQIKEQYQKIINIRITILSLEEGKPVLDINPLDKEVNQEDRLNELKNNLNDYYLKDSLTTGYTTLYYVTNNANYFIRVGLPLSMITNISFNILIFGSIIIIIVNLIYALMKYLFYKRNINLLKESINDLESVIMVPTLKKEDDGIKIINDTLIKIKDDFKNKIEELNAQKNQNDLILDSIEEGFIVLDSAKNVIIINNYALNVLKLKKEDVLNKKYIYLGIEFKLNELIEQDDFNKESFNLDISINGRIYYFLILKTNLSSLKDVFVITFFDVNQNRINETMKKEFFQNASHELKTPLTTIIGYQGMIYNNLIESKDEIKKANEITLKEAKRMKDIIDDMLLISKLESTINDKKEYQLINVKPLLISIINSVELMMQEKNINLKMDLNDTFLKIDPVDFNRLAVNLITNAIKYNKENGLIEIKLDQNNLVVKDNGIGILKKDETRIFERFYRVDKGRSRLEGGTGLGLAIVKHIIIKYNYKIEVNSLIKEGSTFTVYFSK